MSIFWISLNIFTLFYSEYIYFVNIYNNFSKIMFNCSLPPSSKISRSATVCDNGSSGAYIQKRIRQVKLLSCNTQVSLSKLTSLTHVSLIQKRNNLTQKLRKAYQLSQRRWWISDLTSLQEWKVHRLPQEQPFVQTPLSILPLDKLNNQVFLKQRNCHVNLIEKQRQKELLEYKVCQWVMR